MQLSRVPNTGPEVRDRQKRVAHLRQRLAYFRSVPSDRREAECADEGEQSCIRLLKELEHSRSHIGSDKLQPRNVLMPMLLLTVDAGPADALILVIRTNESGVAQGQIRMPEWQEIAAGFDGPHPMTIALRLATSYADAYGYQAILIDIESSQLWDDAWGQLHH